MKKIFYVFIAILSFGLTSCNKCGTSKISELDSIQVQNGLGEDVFVRCSIPFEYDYLNYVSETNFSLLLTSPLLEAEFVCQNRGTFDPKEITIYNLDTIITTKEKILYHSFVNISFLAANSFGVKGRFNELVDMWFFEPKDSWLDCVCYYPETNTFYEICHENDLPSDYYSGEFLDSFVFEGVKYIIFRT